MKNEWMQELGEFREKTRLFYAGEMSKGDYKGFSGKFGSYAQRGGKAGMLRLRLTAGRIDKEKLKFIADVIEEHQVKKVHLTTCMTVQLHDLAPETICALMEQALSHGIITMGGGGDYPRNVMASPLSGAECGEYFDVMPWAEKTAEYLLTLINAEKMPRKLKVCFSNGPANVPHATFRDLGFVAREDGLFDVYCAGGLGNNPRLGVKVAQAVEPSDVLFHVKAMRDMFLAHGNYQQRGRARTRYLQETLGEEGLHAVYSELLERAKKEHPELKVSVQANAISKQGIVRSFDSKRVIAQKQEGLYAVSYHPIGGTPSPDVFGRLYAVIKDMEDVEVRLSPDESLYVINLNGDEVQQVLDVLSDGARTLFETSVACIGASVCQVGVRDSQQLLRSCVDAVREAEIADGALPQIHISGCPSSCGTHQTGEIGFHGGVKLIDKVANPAFTLHILGCDKQGEERLGEPLGVMLEKSIPEFLVRLGKTVEASGLPFSEWKKGRRDEIAALAADYLV